jgi:hypothetical protein
MGGNKEEWILNGAGFRRQREAQVRQQQEEALFVSFRSGASTGSYVSTRLHVAAASGVNWGTHGVGISSCINGYTL